MPQPLSSLIKTRPLKLKLGLPLHEPAICAHAMNVICLASLVEREMGAIVVSLTPGRSAATADIFVESRADSPKRAIRNALAAALLADDEIGLFTALTKKCDTAFTLRNPLAHWSLGYSEQQPDILVAVNPEHFWKVCGQFEKELDAVILDMSDETKSHLHPLDRLSESTIERMDNLWDEHIEVMSAYRLKDLEAIENEINKTLHAVRLFRHMVKFRLLNAAMRERNRLLQQLTLILGLHQPKEGKA